MQLARLDEEDDYLAVTDFIGRNFLILCQLLTKLSVMRHRLMRQTAYCVKKPKVESSCLHSLLGQITKWVQIV